MFDSIQYEIELDNEIKTNNFELIHNESDHMIIFRFKK